MTDPNATAVLTVWRDGDYTVWTALEAAAAKIGNPQWLANIPVADILTAAAGLVVTSEGTA